VVAARVPARRARRSQVLEDTLHEAQTPDVRSRSYRCHRPRRPRPSRWSPPPPSTGRSPTQLGGDRVSVTTIAKPTEDPHFVDARPSQIVALSRADALIEGGAELEIGWLPPLLEGARNGKILAGTPGRIVASEGISARDIPAAATARRATLTSRAIRTFMLDPMNAKIVAEHVVRVFTALDPAGATTYKTNLAQFESALAIKMKEWTRRWHPSPGGRSSPTTHLALLRPPLRPRQRHLPRAQAGDPAVAAAPRRGDAEDEGAETSTCCSSSPTSRARQPRAVASRTDAQVSTSASSQAGCRVPTPTFR
jgi:hypothetical protein